jgi:glycosyltransferase involved in cell wall biosynthesis
VNIFFENVNFESRSGPNSFGRKLRDQLVKNGHNIVHGMPQEIPDIQLSFIMSSIKISPMVQRLDGIYFNSEQDFNSLNSPIESTYLSSDAVIFQSEFNKELTFHYFGTKEHYQIIRNGTDIDLVQSIEPIDNKKLDGFNDVWCCASSWRPHKRLKENIRYFLETSPSDSCLVIAGSNPDVMISDSRVFYAGNLDWKTLISLFKRSSYFLHLSWLDHCPNVVIDARAAGCHVVCSSAGGTREIAGENSTIIIEDDWDFSPIALYKPPKMDFSNVSTGDDSHNINIRNVAETYLNFFNKVLS